MRGGEPQGGADSALVPTGGTIAKDTYERLREEIVEGLVGAGAPLVEAAIAARFGISRTPVREALRRLEQDGLVQRGNRGMEVRSRSPEEILEIYGVRILLEGLAAKSAAESATPLDMASLNERHRQMAKLGTKPGDNKAMALTNRRFHEALWTASHNRTLFDLLVRLNSHLSRYPATTLSHPGRWERVLAEHEELLDTIRNHEVDRAQKLAEEHMTAARDIRLRISVIDSP